MGYLATTVAMATLEYFWVLTCVGLQLPKPMHGLLQNFQDMLTKTGSRPE